MNKNMSTFSMALRVLGSMLALSVIVGACGYICGYDVARSQYQQECYGP